MNKWVLVQQTGLLKALIGRVELLPVPEPNKQLLTWKPIFASISGPYSQGAAGKVPRVKLLYLSQGKFLLWNGVEKGSNFPHLNFWQKKGLARGEFEFSAKKGLAKGKFEFSANKGLVKEGFEFSAKKRLKNSISYNIQHIHYNQYACFFFKNHP